MTNTYRGHEFSYLRFERPSERLLEVIIDRPGDDAPSQLNAVDGTMHAELTAVVGLLAEEDEARCIVLSARGRAFSAGGDFGWFPELADRAALEHLRRDAKRLIYGLLDIPLPIVAVVHGHAMGLGASLALLCDMIFIGRSAMIGDPHVSVGLVAGDGGTIAWPLAVGPARAKQYLLTGDPVEAVEAERIGLVNEVCDDDDLRGAAFAFATRLADRAPLALQYTKMAVNSQLKVQAATAFDQALAHEIATFGSADHNEALAAIAERRTPDFKGI